MRVSSLWPLGAALLLFAAAMSLILYLHAAARTALEQTLLHQLSGVGTSAALLLGERLPDWALLQRLRDENDLDAIYVLDGSLHLVGDASGEQGQKADLLRLDPARLDRAFGGAPSVAGAWEMGALSVASGFFPLAPTAEGKRVLVVEAGESLAASERKLAGARNAAVLLAGLLALAAFVFAVRWTSVQALRREELARSARGEALTRLAAAAAHEIRNPLATIRATAELLGERIAGSEVDDQEAVAGIVSEVDRLRRLTDDLVHLSADRPMSSSEVELNALVDETVYALRQRFPRLDVQVDSGGPAWVLGDGLRLGQVLRNLLQNAAQAEEDGRVRIVLREGRGTVCVRVEDDGPGVDESIRGTLFEAFVTTRARGTGLGLAISRAIAERHGGMLDLVPSTKGAAFELRLPLHDMGGA